MITTDQREFWAQNGYLHLKRIYSETEVDALNKIVHKAWQIGSHFVVVDNLNTGERCRINQVEENQRRRNHFKINDLYLVFQAIRNFVMKEEIIALIAGLLDDAPVLCNTLNIEKGSQQPDHADTLFMTPRSEHKLAATWTALEPVHPDSGPLRYYPGSHKIAPFVFSNGGIHCVEEEMPAWHQYISNEIQRHGLRPELLLADSGDLFIWHANLVHGGSTIRDPQRTRKSIVSHFWTARDCRAANANLVSHGKGFWYRRPIPPLPGEKQPPVPPSSIDVSWWSRFYSRLTLKSSAP